jgi:F0F1-type ATP synthase membrane subunit c/vacuolar-type H+-ATPase subunit K
MPLPRWAGLAAGLAAALAAGVGTDSSAAVKKATPNAKNMKNARMAVFLITVTPF